MKKLFALFVIVAGLALAQNPVVAKFPAEVVTDRDLFVAKNVPRPAVTLAAPVDATTTTLPVTDGTQFRNYQVIGVDLEMMQVCSTTPSSIEVCERGLAGTTPTEHNAGAIISVPLADVHLNRFAAEIKAIQTALGPNLSNVTGLMANYVQGASNLTIGSRAVMVSSAGVVTQSAAQFNTSGTLFIPYGQTITFFGTNNNTALRHNNNSFWIWGAYNGITQMALGEGTTHDDVIHFAYTRGTKGAGQGSLRIGQLSKTDPNWTHGITAFHTLGQERMRINASGNVLIGSETDDGSGAKLQVSGVIKATGITGLATPLSLDQGGIGASTAEQARANLGLGNVENVALSTWAGSSNITTVGTISSGTVPWARLSDVPSSFTPSAHAANHAAGGSDPITSLGGVSFTSSIQVAGYVKAQKQYSFKIYDDNTALPHKTYTDIWWPELGNVTVNSVSCKADTADAVIQFTGITLAANLTCGQATKNSTTNLTDATLTTSETLGVQLISGTAKSITVSLVVTQQ